MCRNSLSKNKKKTENLERKKLKGKRNFKTLKKYALKRKYFEKKEMHRVAMLSPNSSFHL